MAAHDGGTLPPMVPPRPVSERPQIDWDKPVGYAHAAGILALLEARS